MNVYMKHQAQSESLPEDWATVKRMKLEHLTCSDSLARSRRALRSSQAYIHACMHTHMHACMHAYREGGDRVAHDAGDGALGPRDLRRGHAAEVFVRQKVTMNHRRSWWEQRRLSSKRMSPEHRRHLRVDEERLSRRTGAQWRPALRPTGAPRTPLPRAATHRLRHPLLDRQGNKKGYRHRTREAVRLEAHAQWSRGVVLEHHVVEVADLHVARGVGAQLHDLHGVDVQVEGVVRRAAHAPLLHGAHGHRVDGAALARVRCCRYRVYFQSNWKKIYAYVGIYMSLV